MLADVSVHSVSEARCQARVTGVSPRLSPITPNMRRLLRYFLQGMDSQKIFCKSRVKGLGLHTAQFATIEVYILNQYRWRLGNWQGY